MTSKTRAEVARMIDHTLLKPEATAEQVVRLVGEATSNSNSPSCADSRPAPMPPKSRPQKPARHSKQAPTRSTW